MQYRRIEGTALNVSTVSLGSWVFGGDSWGGASDGESISAVAAAIDAGVNFIDTAPVYGLGRSESVIGEALKGRRSKVYLATKCGLEANGKSVRINLSPEFLRKEVDNSLKRLDTDVIDLYQCHWPDKNTPLAETLQEMQKFVKEGKIRYIGVCNFDEKLLEEALRTVPIVSDQIQYSVFCRHPEQKIIPFCEKNGISVLSYGTMGGGILTGKYKEPPVFAKDDVRSFFYKFYKEPFWTKGKALIGVLNDIAASHKATLQEVAINYCLGQGVVSACLLGARTAEQVKDNIKACNWTLSMEERHTIHTEYDRIFVS